MYDEIKPTQKALDLLGKGELNLITLGDSTYIPNCTLEMFIGSFGTAYVKIRNSKGVVVAKTTDVTFPKKWRSLPKVYLSDIAYRVTLIRM